MFRRARRTAPELIDSSAWDVAVARLQRGVQRYFDKVAVLPDRRVRLELRELGTPLKQSLEQLQAAAGADPRLTIDPLARRAVGRAGTLCAHATEAALMAGEAGWHGEQRELARCLDAVSTLVKAVLELVDGCRPRAAA